MKEIRRTIVYRGTDDRVLKALSNALKDGVHDFGAGLQLEIKTENPDACQPEGITLSPRRVEQINEHMSR